VRQYQVALENIKEAVIVASQNLSTSITASTERLGVAVEHAAETFGTGFTEPARVFGQNAAQEICEKALVLILAEVALIIALVLAFTYSIDWLSRAVIITSFGFFCVFVSACILLYSFWSRVGIVIGVYLDFAICLGSLTLVVLSHFFLETFLRRGPMWYLIPLQFGICWHKQYFGLPSPVNFAIMPLDEGARPSQSGCSSDGPRQELFDPPSHLLGNSNLQDHRYFGLKIFELGIVSKKI
jgi:hypothetical protein